MKAGAIIMHTDQDEGWLYTKCKTMNKPCNYNAIKQLYILADHEVSTLKHAQNCPLFVKHH